jgi:hypothetical protein
MSVESEATAWITAARPIVPPTLSVRLLATVHTLRPQAAAPWRRRGAVAAACVALAAGVALAVYTVREPAAPSLATGSSTNEPASTTVLNTAPSRAPTSAATVAADPSAAVAARHQTLGVPLSDFHQRVACTGCHGIRPTTQAPPALPKTCVGCHPVSHGKRFAEKQCLECHRVTAKP